MSGLVVEPEEANKDRLRLTMKHGLEEAKTRINQRHEWGSERTEVSKTQAPLVLQHHHLGPSRELS